MMTLKFIYILAFTHYVIAVLSNQNTTGENFNQNIVSNPITQKLDLFHSIEVVAFPKDGDKKPFIIYSFNGTFVENPLTSIERIKIKIMCNKGIPSKLAILLEMNTNYEIFDSDNINWALIFPDDISDNEATFNIYLQNHEQIIPLNGTYRFSGVVRDSENPPLIIPFFTENLEFSEFTETKLCHTYNMSKLCLYSQFQPKKLLSHTFKDTVSTGNISISIISLFICTILPFTALMTTWIFVMKLKMELFDFSWIQTIFCLFLTAMVVLILGYFTFLPFLTTMKMLLPLFISMIIVAQKALSDIQDKRFHKYKIFKKKEE